MGLRPNGMFLAGDGRFQVQSGRQPADDPAESVENDPTRTLALAQEQSPISADKPLTVAGFSIMLSY